MRPNKDEVGLLIAKAWSMRGTCARRKVGCLLVDADGRTLSSGYNGPARGCPNCLDTGGPMDRRCPGADLPSGTGLDQCEALHAEWNALMYCEDVRKVHTCYVTSSPCVTCVKMLLGTGCQRIVYDEEYAQHKAAFELWTMTRRPESWVSYSRDYTITWLDPR